MTSRYRLPPGPKKPTSHRLPVSVIRKIEMIRELWKARAEADGESPEYVDDINDTHVVSTLLDIATDAELAEFGGMPKDESALKAMVAGLKKAAKK
jgi:hypothetical protein